MFGVRFQSACSLTKPLLAFQAANSPTWMQGSTSAFTFYVLGSERRLRMTCRSGFIWNDAVKNPSKKSVDKSKVLNTSDRERWRNVSYYSVSIDLQDEYYNAVTRVTRSWYYIIQRSLLENFRNRWALNTPTPTNENVCKLNSFAQTKIFNAKRWQVGVIQE